MNDCRWPAIGIPNERHDRQGRAAFHLERSFEVGGKPGFAVGIQRAGVTGADQRTIGGAKKNAAAALQHIDARLVQIRPRYVFAAPDTNVIRALWAATATAPVYKQIIIVIVPA